VLAAAVLVIYIGGALQEIPVGAPLTEHAKLTCPRKPPEGVRVRELFPSKPAVTLMFPPFVSVKLPTPPT
jgi:hypothetical protein